MSDLYRTYCGYCCEDNHERVDADQAEAEISRLTQALQEARGRVTEARAFLECEQLADAAAMVEWDKLTRGKLPWKPEDKAMRTFHERAALIAALTPPSVPEGMERKECEVTITDQHGNSEKQSWTVSTERKCETCNDLKGWTELGGYWMACPDCPTSTDKGDL